MGGLFILYSPKWNFNVCLTHVNDIFKVGPIFKICKYSLAIKFLRYCMAGLNSFKCVTFRCILLPERNKTIAHVVRRTPLCLNDFNKKNKCWTEFEYTVFIVDLLSRVLEHIPHYGI